MLIRDVVSLQLGGLPSWSGPRGARLARHGLSVPLRFSCVQSGVRRRPLLLEGQAEVGAAARPRVARPMGRAGCFAGNGWPMSRRGGIVTAHGASSGGDRRGLAIM